MKPVIKLISSIRKNLELVNLETNWENYNLNSKVMKATFNKKTKSDSKVNTSFKKRNYHFHPDENFREDHTWGKAKSPDLSNSESVKDGSVVNHIKS